MAGISINLPADYWQSLIIDKTDIESIQAFLFEEETPLTVDELVEVLVHQRIQREQEAALSEKQDGGKVYLPAERYASGVDLVFPALEWAHGKVIAVREGNNPEAGSFDVITVKMASGEERMFAAGLEAHVLNQPAEETEGQDLLDPKSVTDAFGQALAVRLSDALQGDDGLVRIAGRWFPRALLVDVNTGHLNLAEAVLDMAGGEPQPTPALLKDVELPAGVNPKLAEFSLNYALQEDERFDEVGPAGQVLWCLQRLEPEDVRLIPQTLRYVPAEYDRGSLSEEALGLEADLDDEWSDLPAGDDPETVVCLTYPHWRAGTLPVSARLRTLLPTAYESARVRFTMVDARSEARMPAWVVRQPRYVQGLSDWYQENGLIPGSLVSLRHGDLPGEVKIEAQTRRASRDWVRTAIIGADGGLVFALLKQMVTADFNERMAIAIPDVDAVDTLWAQMAKSHPSLEAVVVRVMREMTKLNPQGHVHAQELYSAVNILRRCPPGPLLALLTSKPQLFNHVGDLHYRLDESPDE